MPPHLLLKCECDGLVEFAISKSGGVDVRRML